MSIPYLESQIMKVGAPVVVPSYVDHPTSPEVLARFGDGPTLSLKRGRERSYPGLKGEAPPTLPLYERAIDHLGPMCRILDAGCGAGAGTQMLTLHYDEVVGIDRDARALQFARRCAPEAKLVEGDLSFPQVIGTVDGAVLIDVLGHATLPEEVLLSLRTVLTAGRKVFIAESTAMSAQYLRAPTRRAYSPSSLVTLLTVCGYEITEWVETDGPFLLCVATPFSGESWEDLRNGYGELAGGRTDDALACFRQAISSTRSAVRLEAVLGEAECRLSQRDGDGAIRCYFHARDLAPGDARPMAGLARIALSMGNAGDAAQLAEAALRLDPTDLAALCAHALIAERARPDRAKGRWLIASNLAPDAFDIALHLAQAAAEDGDYTLAVWALERVRAYGEDHGVPMHIALASALLGAGRVADAQLEARMAQTFAPFDPSVMALVDQLEAAKR